MDERWQKIERLYHAARELDADQQSRFLDEACRSDAEMRRQLDDLLKQSPAEDNFLNIPAVEFLALAGTASSLAPKTRIGPYEIIGGIGAGGMGEVYKARDTRLNRNVAIKIVLEAFTARFEREARAISSLNHPHVCTLYDVGPNYLVMEWIEGETFAARLEKGRLPLEIVLRYGAQIADALAAAHAKGIIHRDLKPGNVMITKSGIKVLDFGLAKAAAYETLMSSKAVMGTPAYMPPEQREGKKCDARTDIYALGLLLHEAATGKRVSPDRPADLSGLREPATHVILRCLEPDPEDRWQSAIDLKRELLWTSTITQSPSAAGSVSAPKPIGGARRKFGVALLALLLVAVAFIIGRSFPSATNSQTVAVPDFQRLTFRRGTVRSARFTPDGKTILYGAAWDGDPLRIFLTRPENTESARVPLPDADILSISSQGELAVSLRGKFEFWISMGILARSPLVGGSSRELLENVSTADWSPDGKELAVIRRLDGGDRLEYPIGKTLLETTGYFSHVRVSPKGDRIAFLDHPGYGDNRGNVAMVDLQGKKTSLSEELSALEGLAWNPDTGEVWYTGSKTGERWAVYASDLSGRQRKVLQVPSDLTLQDILPGGRTLMTGTRPTREVFGIAPGETAERNLSALSLSGVNEISADGHYVAITENEAANANYDVYIRKTDGSGPIRIGQGLAWSFSPDGKWVLATTFAPPELSILPVGAGEAKRFKLDLTEYQGAQFLTNDRIVLVGRIPGHAARTYIMDLEDGKPRPITPEGVPSTTREEYYGKRLLTAPDGNRFIMRDGADLVMYSTAGDKLGVVPGWSPKDFPVRWAQDSKSIFVANLDTRNVRIFRLDLQTGRRDMWREAMVSDPVGIAGPVIPVITPDGRAYAYTAMHLMSDLYLVEGLK